MRANYWIRVGAAIAGVVWHCALRCAAQCPPSWSADAFHGLNGDTRAILVLANGDLVAGGTFSRCCPMFSTNGGSVGNLARWTNGAWQPFAGTYSAGLFGGGNSVLAIADLGNGRLVVGGTFLSGSNSGNYSRVALWTGTSWQAMGAGFDGNVNALLVMPNGDVFAGGEFANADGQPASRIARWTGSAWQPIGTGVSGGSVYTLVRLANGDVVAGGSFTSAGGNAANRVAVWNGTTWTTLSSGMNAGGTVYALAQNSQGDIVAGGSFTSAGGGPASNIAVWHAGAWAQLGSGIAGGPVRAILALSTGELVVTGQFSQAGGTAVNNVARWTGSQWARMQFSTGLDSTGYAVARKLDGTIVIGGAFAGAESEAASSVAKWSGSAWLPLNGSLNSRVRAITSLANGRAAAIGDFWSAGGKRLNFVAQWDGQGWQPMGAGLPRHGYCIAQMPNGDVVADGSSTLSSGSCGVWRWNGASWSAVGPTFTNGGSNIAEVTALLALPSGEMLAGGMFTAIGAVQANRIAKWTGTAWQPMGAGFDDTVRAILRLPDGRLVAAGRFLNTGATPAQRVAVWDGASWQPMGSGLPAQVNALALLADGRIAAGLGDEFPVQAAFVWDGVGWSAMGNLAGGTTGVYSLALDGDGALWAAGTGQVGVSKWNGNAWIQQAAYSTYDGAPPCIARLDAGRLMVGGGFWNIANTPSYGWAIVAPVPLSLSQGPTSIEGCTGGQVSLSVQATSFTSPQYRWSKGAVLLGDGPTSAGSVLSGSSSPTLTISNSQPADSGQYQCQVSIPGCSLASSGVSVLVQTCACSAADVASEGSPDLLSGPDGFVTGVDFDVFVAAFFKELRRSTGVLVADLADSVGNPGPDGFLTGTDFDFFVIRYFAGCD